MIQTALKQLGVKEFKDGSNPEVTKYFKAVKGNFGDDSVPWCSAFVNWCAMQEGYERSGLANARSWLTIGKATDKPFLGDVVVFWRGTKTAVTGHVALFLQIKGDKVQVIGGNQSDAVTTEWYPLSRVLGYRKINKKVI